MADIAPPTRPLPLLCSRTPAADQLSELTAGLPLRLLDSPAQLGPMDSLLLVLSDDRPALERALGSGATSWSLPVVALAEDESSGLAAVRRGACDWVIAGDRPGLEKIVKTCLARRIGRPFAAALPETGDDGDPRSEEYLRAVHRTRDASLRTVGLLLERRDLETKGHTDRVVSFAARLAEHLGLGAEERQALRWGAYLHDIGKIALPDTILFKRGPLTAAELIQVRKHAEVGYEMLGDLPFLPAASRRLVRHHHERWDGLGYPDGLAGVDIPLLARLFSVVDVHDALASRRPYKPAWPRHRVIETLHRGAGRLFDPEIVASFMELLEGQDGLRSAVSDRSVTVSAGP